MTFPIIQQPSPLQQLSSLIQNLRQQAMERRMQEEEIVRRQQYLQLAQQEAAGNAAYRADQTRRADRTFEYGLERDKVSDAANAEAASLARRRQHETETGNLLERGRQALPPGYTATPQALLDIAKGRNDLSSLPQGRPGLQGSATRAPTPATEGGITHTPGVLSYNAPSGGGSGGGRGYGHIDQRHQLGAGLMRRIVDRANALYGENPSNVEVPMTADIGGAAAERILGHGAGSRVGDRIRNIGASSSQQEFRGLREQFKHSMAVFFPRVSIALMENLSDSYFPVGGETGQAAQAKMQALNDVAMWIERVSSGQASHQDLAAVIARTGGPAGALLLQESQTGAQSGTNSAGQPVGVPAASPSGSAVDRYIQRLPR